MEIIYNLVQIDDRVENTFVKQISVKLQDNQFKP